MFPCDPTLSWQLVDTATLPSPKSSPVGLQQNHECRRTLMDEPLKYNLAAKLSPFSFCISFLTLFFIFVSFCARAEVPNVPNGTSSLNDSTWWIVEIQSWSLILLQCSLTCHDLCSCCTLLTSFNGLKLSTIFLFVSGGFGNLKHGCKSNHLEALSPQKVGIIT